MIDTRALHKNLTIPCQTKQSTAVFGHLADDYEYVPSTTWFQHLIRMLCFIKYDPNCQRRFINKYRQIYQNNKNNLNILNEFEQQYHHSNSIRWYTKDYFLFHCLNKALRQQDIHTIFLLHFFIYDLFHQVLSIRKLNNQNIQHIVYRGQIITKDELSYLNFSETKRYIYVNAFFSTTMELRTALIFSGAGSYSKNDEEQSAVFKINIKENNEDYFGIYADIKDFSVNSDENEIIFTMGNAFVIDKVEYNEEEKVWFIERTLDLYGADTSDWCDPDGDPIEEDESIRICHVNTSNMIEATFIHLAYLLQSAVKSSETYQQVNFSCFYPWTMNEILNRLLYIARLWKERNKFESIIQLSDLLEQKRKDNLSFSAFFGLWLDDHPIGE
ncbi:unnamed protein product [Rotaria sordida]|uniref:NAD(P)(+)--arginine ADP-ribosyltransferase n=2 Tax=Rotaria sordida TaxID=392033 RepID=A0A819J167_9BILA|nr:unnamed protein product [Rotaria sordida]